MGVLDTGSLAMRGGFDFNKARSMIDYLRERVMEMPDAEAHGNGLFVKHHLHSTLRSQLLAKLDEAQTHIEAAEQDCEAVSLAL